MKKFLLLSVWASLNLPGQSKKMNLAQCLDFALANNEHIKTAEYEIDYQKQFKKASTEIPKTVVIYSQGQFNSAYKYDNSFAINQQIPFPAVFAAHHSLAQAHIEGSHYKLAATRADLIYQVKTTYYELIYHYSLQALLEKEDSIYLAFAKTQQEKYASGAGNLLEKTTAETKVMEIKNQILENEEDINADQIHLQTLLNSNTEVSVNYEDLTEKPLQLGADSGDLFSHPYLLYLNHQVRAGRKNKLLELYKTFPDLQAGYFNLSIFGPADIGNGPYVLTNKDRLQGFTLGISIPLWFYPLAAKVKAADAKTRIAQSEYNYNRDVFEGDFKQAHALYLKYQNSILFYKNKGLVNSKAIINQAQRSYETKEISYIDYLTVISNALSIESRYLNVVNQNNLMVLKLEYLMTK